MKRWIKAATSYLKAVKGLRLVHSIPQLNLGLERQEALRDQLTAQRIGLTGHIDSLRDQLVQQRTEFTEHIDSLDALRDQLTAQRTGLTGHIDSLRDQVVQQRTEFTMHIDSLRDELVEQRTEFTMHIDSLRDELVQQRRIFTEHIDLLRHQMVTSLAEVGAQQAAFQPEVREVKEQLRQHKQIDVVLLGDIKLFIYTDDLSYLVIPEESRHYRLSRKDYQVGDPKAVHSLAEASGSHQAWEGGQAANVRRGPNVMNGWRLNTQPENLTALLLTAYWAAGLDPTVIDVGASYGFEAIYTARYIRRHGKSGIVVAFEPGVAGGLLGHNVVLNGVADCIRVERAAVGNCTGPTVMFGERGQSQNNRIVNRWVEGEDFSSIVFVDSLDAYVKRHGLQSDFLVKVDTQGGEPEVLEGMKGLLGRGTTTLITEFSPNALRTRVTPQQFLHSLARYGTIFDLAQKGPLCPVTEAGLPQVQKADFDQFTAEVVNRPYEWSDLLLVPFQLPRRKDLLAALTRAGSQA